jgi:tetratricopeptide (TPR) repeat protein
MDLLINQWGKGKRFFGWRLGLIFASAMLWTPKPVIAAEDSVSQVSRAKVLITENGNFDEAKRILAKVIAVEPQKAEAYFWFGRMDYALKKFDNAVEYLEKAVGLNERNSDSHLWLGKATAASLRNASLFRKPFLAGKAKKEFETAVALDPKNVPARVALMAFYLEAPGIVGGSKENAVEQAKEITKVDRVEGQYAFAYLYQEQKAYEKAEQQYKVAILIDPKRSESYFRLGSVYVDQNKLQEAEQSFVKAIMLDPRHLHASYQLAKIYLSRGEQLDKAEEYFRKYFSKWPEENTPTWAGAHWRLGQVYEKQGKKTLAVAEWKEAIRLEPDMKQARESLKNLDKQKP